MRYYIEEDTSTTPPTLVKVPICGSYINYNTAPIGSIQQYSGTSLPPGWLWCNGSAYNRTFYKFLFNVIGTTYGTGDGSTTFNVPSIPDLATGIKYIIKAYSTADAKTLGIDLPDSPTSGGGHWAHVYEEWTSYLNGMASGSTFVAPKTGMLHLFPANPPAGATANAFYRSYIAAIEDGTVVPSIIWVSTTISSDGTGVATNVSSGILKKGHTYTLVTNNPNMFCLAAIFLEYIEDEADPDPAGDTYSTIETKVGTWIDGKPIYRIAINENLSNPTVIGVRTNFIHEANLGNISIINYGGWLAILQNSSAPQTVGLKLALPITASFPEGNILGIGASAIVSYNANTGMTNLGVSLNNTTTYGKATEINLQMYIEYTKQ